MNVPDNAGASGSRARHFAFLSLPEETQREIFSHCNMPELVCLALVSRHFHHMASGMIYRSLTLSVPCHGNRLYQDTMAACLNTFTTSEYDYARHLRELFVYSYYGVGPDADRAIAPYSFTESCGKFLNTLLLLSLRKAKGLERFSWNVRIELARPLYKALHHIDTLSDVHIRLQKGPSMYESVPRLPLPPQPGSTTFMPQQPPAFMDPMSPLPAFAQFQQQPPSAFAQINSAYHFPISSPPPPLRVHSRARPSKRTLCLTEPPTISGFKNLRHLSIVDIDSLDLIDEIRTCVRNSAGTLIVLTLSFSDSLAYSVRKPISDSDTDDSDIDVDDIAFGMPPPIIANAATAGHTISPSKIAFSQQERSQHDAALWRIFDLKPQPLSSQPPTPANESPDNAAAENNEDSDAKDAGDRFIKALREMTVHLLTSTTGDGITEGQQKKLDTILHAARKYIGRESNGEGDQEQGGSSNTGDNQDSDADPKMSTEEGDKAETSLFRNDQPIATFKTLVRDAIPEDIDVEAPEGQLVIEDATCEDVEPEPLADAGHSSSAETQPELPGQEEPTADKGENLVKTSKFAANISAQRTHLEALLNKVTVLEGRVEASKQKLEAMCESPSHASPEHLAEAEKRDSFLRRDIRRLCAETRAAAAEVRDINAEALLDTDNQPTSSDGKSARYVRSTRGMALQELNISMIPTTPSVLSQAIDLHALVRITLLNVGPQAPIWLFFAKENKVQPLPLRTIFTDNVTAVFLRFVGELDEVHSLLLMERDTKYRPGSLAPKTVTTMDDIRHLVLKKHAAHLEKLMLHNAASQEWDVDEATIKLLGRRGQKLEELAVSMKMRRIHDLLHYLPNFTSLRALNIIRLRYNEDSRIFSTQEVKRFVLDSMTHCPHLKLEWLAIDNDLSVERIRHQGKSKKAAKKSEKSKGKEKATGSDLADSADSTIPGMSLLSTYIAAATGTDDGEANEKQDKPYSEDSGDESDSDSLPFKQAKLKFDHYHIDDVWGVVIFEKIVRVGQL